MSSVQSTFLAENQFWLSNSPKQNFYLYLELQGGEAPAAANRVPLNLSLVIDRSGSMQGDKIAYAKKAAEFVVDNLSVEDRVSIVQYDDVVEVLSPSAPVENKADLRRRIAQMAARNMTDLGGGLQAGYAQVSQTKQDRFVNRVLLLSDGLANHGITDPAMLQQIAQDKFRNAGIALSTFGVGADFNELLMTGLSEYGGANYYFIESPDKIPGIFAEELKGLLAVVAQGVTLEVQLPIGDFRCEKVYGFPAEISHDKVQINFNDLFSKEKKAVLLKMTALRPIGQNFNFQVKLAYDNVVGTYGHIESEQSIAISATADPEKVTAGAQTIVLEQTTLFVANDQYEEAIRLVERGDREGAKRLIQQIKALMEQHFQTLPPSEELKKQYEEILRYERQMEEFDYMSQHDVAMAMKASRSQSYAMRRKK